MVALFGHIRFGVIVRDGVSERAYVWVCRCHLRSNLDLDTRESSRFSLMTESSSSCRSFGQLRIDQERKLKEKKNDFFFFSSLDFRAPKKKKLGEDTS